MMLGDLGILTTTTNSGGSTTYSGAGASTMISNAQGIYNSANGFWTNDGGATLSAYLNGKTFATNGNNGSRALGNTATPAAGTSNAFGAGAVTLTSTAGNTDGYRIYAAIMRLYNRSFMIKSTNFAFTAGTGGGCPADWRKRFFNTSTNTTLYDSSGNWKAATPNYQEIIYWLKNCGPTHSMEPEPPEGSTPATSPTIRPSRPTQGTAPRTKYSEGLHRLRPRSRNRQYPNLYAAGPGTGLFQLWNSERH